MKIKIFNKDVFKKIDLLGAFKGSVLLSEIALLVYLAINPSVVSGYKEPNKFHFKNTKENWRIERVSKTEYTLVDIELLFKNKYNLNPENNTDLSKFINDIKIYLQDKPYCVSTNNADDNIVLYHVDDIINGTHIYPIVTLYYNAQTELLSFNTTQYYYIDGERGTINNKISYIFDKNGNKVRNITSKSKIVDGFVKRASVSCDEDDKNSIIKYEISDEKDNLIYVHLIREKNNYLLHLNFNTYIEKDIKLSKDEYQSLYEILKNNKNPEDIIYDLSSSLEYYVTFIGEEETTEYRYKKALESIEILSKDEEIKY